EEIGGADALLHLEPDALGGGLPRALPGPARLLLLLLHRRVEGPGVDADAARLECILREIEREAVGVVELEGGLAGEHVALAQARARLAEEPQPLLQGLAEPRLLELQGLGDEG